MDIQLEIKAVGYEHLDEIFDLLQSISVFRPVVSRSVFKGFCEQKNVNGMVVISNGTVIGFGYIALVKNIRGGCIGFIEDIVVSQSFRGKGVGTLIIDYLADLGRKYGCYKLVLQCKEDTMPFYGRLGFKHTGSAVQMFLE
jgi:glucosamine-phosphate N-acetyltransferase